jgi:hypothetical protein
MLDRPDELYRETVNILIFVIDLGHFESTVQRTVSTFLNLFNLVFFLLDRFVFMDEFDRMGGVGREAEAESAIEPVSWSVW